jgi:lysophospholipase
MQHIAATSSSVEVLRVLLLKGASVHLRNKAGRTPLFLAANAGLHENVSLLRQSGAHLHPDELAIATMQGQREPSTWQAAGL